VDGSDNPLQQGFTSNDRDEQYRCGRITPAAREKRTCRIDAGYQKFSREPIPDAKRQDELLEKV
jgi:hypothetical protein